MASQRADSFPLLQLPLRSAGFVLFFVLFCFVFSPLFFFPSSSTQLCGGFLALFGSLRSCASVQYMFCVNHSIWGGEGFGLGCLFVCLFFESEFYILLLYHLDPDRIHYCNFFFSLLCTYSFFFFPWPQLQHVEVPRPEIEPEFQQLQPVAFYALFNNLFLICIVKIVSSTLFQETIVLH